MSKTLLIIVNNVPEVHHILALTNIATADQSHRQSAANTTLYQARRAIRQNTAKQRHPHFTIAPCWQTRPKLSHDNHVPCLYSILTSSTSLFAFQIHMLKPCGDNFQRSSLVANHCSHFCVAECPTERLCKDFCPLVARWQIENPKVARKGSWMVCMRAEKRAVGVGLLGGNAPLCRLGD